MPTPRRLIAALVTAGLVALSTHAATVFLFFVANGAVAEQLAPINSFFLVSSLLLFLLVAIAALFGALSRWYLATLVGLLAGVVAALVGTTITFASAGNPITGEVLPTLFQTLLGNNLVFIVAATIATITIGTAMWWRALAYSARGEGPRNLVLVRQPPTSLDDGQVTHKEREAVDLELAETQWEAYVGALGDAGFEVIEIEPAHDLPDSVFVEDTVVMLDDTAIVTMPGSEVRRDENSAVEAVVRDLGYAVQRIELPGTLDGGDVLKVGSTIYVGRTDRTNAEGIRQVREIAGDLGYTVVAVPVSRVLHLKTAVTALPDGTVIGYLPNVEHPELFERFLAVPEATGVAMVVLSDDAILLSASAPQTAALLADLGYRVVTVDVSEYEKREGSVTCLSVRIR